MLNAFAGHTDEIRDWVERLAIDGDDVAQALVEGFHSKEFLILPLPVVLDYFQRKALDYDRWITGIQKLSDLVT